MERAAPRCVLFDMDGVLVRSEEIWFQLVAEAGVRFRGGRAVTREEFAPTFGQGTAADVELFGLRCSPAELDRFYTDHFLQHLDAMWINPDAKPVLEALVAQGRRLAVVTNTVSKLAREVLRAAGLLEWLNVVACADQVPHAKPAPDVVLHALRALGEPPERAWMVGDSRFDREAAGAAGVYFVGLGIPGDLSIDSLESLPSRVGAG